MKTKIFILLAFCCLISKTVDAKNVFEKEILNKNCVKLCGDGYFYDRPGAKRNGAEIVCTRYPLPCNYACTIGWNFQYLIDGTDYTCQEAIQFDSNYSSDAEPELIKARSLH